MIRNSLNKYVEITGQMRKDSLLITLGNTIQKLTSNYLVDIRDEKSVSKMYGRKKRNWGTQIIKPHEIILISSEEEVKLSKNCFGIISTLSHVARLGLSSNPTSFFVDPLFSGYLTLEVVNLTQNRIRLYQGMPVAKLVFLKCDDKNLNSKSSNVPILYGSKDELKSQFYNEFVYNSWR